MTDPHPDTTDDAPTVESPSHCLNCGTELRGPYCHACGQPVKGMVRQFSFIVRDFLDVVFEYDSRIWRSLVPLYFRPGRITRQFLDGKRMRFVLPFRLFFVLTVVSLLVVQLMAKPIVVPGATAVLAIREADSTERVLELKNEALARLAVARQALGDEQDAAVAQQLTATASAIREAARVQIDWIQRAEKARAEGRASPPRPASDVFGAGRSEPGSHPFRIGWLPDAANARIDAWIVRAERNLQRTVDEPGWLMDSFLGRLPAALFVLMPVFALLLKLFYLGKRWLYTAHLVVALHSHSFLALAMMVSVLLARLSQSLHGVPWLAAPAGWATTASELWIPLYLLLMQRRVYGQGWALTLTKFCLIGSLYAVLLGLTLIAVAAISLVLA